MAATLLPHYSPCYSHPATAAAYLRLSATAWTACLVDEYAEYRGNVWLPSWLPMISTHGGGGGRGRRRKRSGGWSGLGAGGGGGGLAAALRSRGRKSWVTRSTLSTFTCVCVGGGNERRGGRWVGGWWGKCVGARGGGAVVARAWRGAVALQPLMQPSVSLMQPCVPLMQPSVLG